MNYYHIWCNLRDTSRDLQFCKAIDAYLGHLKGKGLLEGFTLSRRKLGFGPPALGEFHVVISTRDLAQLESAFSTVATRTGEVERLHAAVWSAVTDFTSALYRDYPDPERE